MKHQITLLIASDDRNALADEYAKLAVWYGFTHENPVNESDVRMTAAILGNLFAESAAIRTIVESNNLTQFSIDAVVTEIQESSGDPEKIANVLRQWDDEISPDMSEPTHH